jgi:hypothetical protein
MRWTILVVMALVVSAMLSGPALAWGDEGHEVIALIAQEHLNPIVKKKLRALVAADTDNLTTHDIAAASTWPDKLRDQNDDSARQRTRQWHFVDIEIAAPDLNRACFGHPSLLAGTLASNGPAHTCVIDKTEQFVIELISPATKPEEQIIAMQRTITIAAATVRGCRSLGSGAATCTTSGTRCRSTTGSKCRPYRLGPKRAHH